MTPSPAGARAAVTRRSALALACGFALFVTAAIGVGRMVWREPDSAETPPRTPPTPRSTVASVQPSPTQLVGRLDEGTRVASIGSASLTLPPVPYELYDDPVDVDGFDIFFVADAPVHRRYDGRHTWSATVALAHLDPGWSTSTDLDRAGSTIMKQLSHGLFDEHATTWKVGTPTEHSVDGHPGALFTAEVHYSVDRLPSRFDRLSALVIELDDGSFVVAVSSVPDDASSQVVEQAARSLRSLAIS